MPGKATSTNNGVDALLKALLVLTRTVDHILEERAAASVQPGSLSASKLQVLRLLGHRGPQPTGRIARFLAVSKPAVSQIIDALVLAGLVTRRPNEADRRGVFVELSKRGQKSFQEITRTQRHLLRAALRLSGKGSISAWTNALEQMIVGLTRADQNFHNYCLQCGAHEDDRCVLVGGDATCMFLQELNAGTKRRRTVARR